MRILFRIKSLGLALVAAAWVFIPTSSGAADKVVLGLDWQALGRHAGFFVAKAKGFYTREGLDIEIQRGYGAADAVKRLAAGESTFTLAITARWYWPAPKASMPRPSP